MNRIDYHADDYGLSVHNSKRILELIESGKLDSISIISNMGCFDDCMELLNEKWASFSKKPLISIHINLIDGYCLSKPGEIIHGSWGNLFIRSLLPGTQRTQLRNSLKEEIKCQILAVNNSLSELSELRLDSHVHTHMIPVVFDAMLEAVNELDFSDKLTFVRNSKEPLLMFLTTKGIANTFPMVNAIKNIILNLLSLRVSRKLRRLNLPKAMLWGLIMSGQMDNERVKKLSPSMQSYASKRDNYLEILCHPGLVLESEIRPEYGKADLSFVLSSNRDVEYQMIQNRE